MKPSEPVFENKHGTFYRIVRGGGPLGDRVLYAADEIAVCFSVGEGDDMWTLCKIGPADSVSAYYEEQRERMKASGLAEWADRLCLIASSRWDPEDLQRMVDITGALPAILSRYGLAAKTPDGRWALAEPIVQTEGGGEKR